jgi:hypothetical protein
MAMAVTLIIVGVAVYTAYRWYFGSNTVPVPSYLVGFKDVPVRPSRPGVQQNASEANEFFMNPPGMEKEEEDKAEDEINTPGADTPGANTQGVNTPGVNIPQINSLEVKESFYGGVARGAGSPDCLRSSSEGAALIAMYKCNDTVQDYHELKQIVGKLSCFKKDLVSPSYIVDATRSQEFVTMHDIEPIAETTGRCFAKTISPRDLELSFDKWTRRGEQLLRRLAASQKQSPSQVDMAQNLFRALVRDVKDIARGACFVGEPTIAGKPGPRDPHPYENPDLEELGPYSGYY